MAPKKGGKRMSAVVTSRKVVEETVQVVITPATTCGGEAVTESQQQPSDESKEKVPENQPLPSDEVPKENEQVEAVSTPTAAEEDPPATKRTISVEEKKEDPPATERAISVEDENEDPPATKRTVSVEDKNEDPPPENPPQRRKRKRAAVGAGEGYKRYVYKVLKQVHPELGISSKAMTVVNNLIGDMFERIAAEAAVLTKYVSRRTLSTREIQDAVKLVLPGELGKHAISEGMKAVTNYIGTLDGDDHSISCLRPKLNN
ncbi:unnamed protein product [Cuscuta epithymum]|uniref:Core Histone H2A/H2B/H3 domain-containing protein n=1 Tax=Cuscuta epithymum TaxID=186058 RepID=A0AAV0ELZ0_9ASTE|nr:unnamed protein product [Cuscuta epithymum]